MKSYADLDQCRMLAAGILPPESADMYWKNGVSDKYIQCFTPFVIDESGTNIDLDYDVPCWSLAALSEFILPSIADNDGNNYKFYLSKDGLDRWVAYYKSGNLSIHICEESYNMIDVILEMVCWLKAEKYI